MTTFKIRTLLHRGVRAAAILVVLYTPPAVFGSDSNPTSIPRWLHGYDVQPEFIPMADEDIGFVKSLEGRVVIIHQETDEAFFGKVGDPVFRKDLIATLAGSVCRIQFSSKDSANLSPNSILTLESYLDSRSEKKKSAVLKMKAGRVFFYVLRLLGYRDTDFRVETPSSVAAVRGTKFGLHVYESKDPETGEDAVFTNCYCADGLIEIDGLLVRKGELYESAAETVQPAPPDYLNQFHTAFNLPAPVLEVTAKANNNRALSNEMPMPAGDQTAAHTDNIQEKRYVDLVMNQKTEPAPDPSPGPNDPPVNDDSSPDPTEPNPPPVNEPPTAPSDPPDEGSPIEPTPPSPEPPNEPGRPPVPEPPPRPEEPPASPDPLDPPTSGPAEPPRDDDLDPGDDRPDCDPGHSHGGDEGEDRPGPDDDFEEDDEDRDEDHDDDRDDDRDDDDD
ncbi:MAG: FecR domain-containing protein [Thermodesulfobacteriota bacterium]